MITIAILLLFLSCSSDDFLPDENIQTYPSNTCNKISYCEDAQENGAQNAVKKAYQMTDLYFTPLAPIVHRSGFFEKGVTYKGVIYSSAKELEMFVGNDVGIYTFLSAINNPRSKIYTEDISKPPYHGTNGKTYYGAICSSFVSFALGLEQQYWSCDFPLSEKMKEIDINEIDSIRIADVLWREGHVALITDTIKDIDNNIAQIEISECIGTGCKRYYLKRNKLKKLLGTSYQKVLRYSELYKNTDYTPFLLEGNVSDSFCFNEYLCVVKGDKSCFVEGEDVVINILHDYDYIEIYKDEMIIQKLSNNGDVDIILSNLEYGDYKARIFYKDGFSTTNINEIHSNTRSTETGSFSDFTYWKVVNLNVYIDKSKGRIYFSSTNATPISVRYTDIHGNGQPINVSTRHMLTRLEIEQGYIDVQPGDISPDYPYLRVKFQTEYGRVINYPINWFE